MPGSQSICPKDASDQLGSLSNLAITVDQVINVFNTYITNTKLSKLLDVNTNLDSAPIDSIFIKGSDGLWTYSSISEYALLPATNSVLGGVIIGDGITVDSNGLISIIFPDEYVLPIASASVLGGIKIGTGLSIDVNGVLSSSAYAETDPIFTAWNKSTGISITESQISNLRAYLLSEVDPVFTASPAFGITLGNIANWNSLVNYTHPTQSAISPSLSGALVPSAIIANTLGHVTSISTRTLTLSDLGYDGVSHTELTAYDLDVVHKSLTETITGPKTFSATSTVFKTISTNSIGGVAIDSVATGANSFAYSGVSDNVPMQLANSSIATTGHRIGLVLRGDSANVAGANGFGLDISFRLPCLGWIDPLLSEIPGGLISCILTDNTQNAEYSEYEWWLQKGGVLTKSMWLDGNGNLNVTGNINSSSSQTVFTITLPSSGSVSGRCVAAISGTDYPSGWTIAADTNPNDMLITHSLGRRIVTVSVYTVIGSSERLLYANAAYAGIIALTSSTLRIDGLATVGTPIVIHCIFA